jgi:hypothetical protein
MDSGRIDERVDGIADTESGRDPAEDGIGVEVRG